MNVKNFTLAGLPFSAKITVTCFLIMIGFGYLAALAQIYVTHRGRDGDPTGLSYDDMRATYHGLDIEIKAEEGKPLPSRILEQIEGDMREYFKSDEEFQIVYDWLAAGATEEGLKEGGKKSAGRVIKKRCLKCHSVDSGEGDAEESPFGPDMFEVDFKLLSEYTSAGGDEVAGDGQTKTKRIGPAMNVNRLIKHTHEHMLAIPVFTFLVGILYFFTGIHGVFKAWTLALPMMGILADIASWWAARWMESLVTVTVAAGGVYGFFFAVQIFTIFGSMWFGRRPAAQPS